MLTIAALGPANTFSERAAQHYAALRGSEHTVTLCPTFGKAFDAVGHGADCAILPIENIAEGYVSIVLDLLIHSNLSIVNELLLPINFSLVANSKSLKDIEKIYAQFVTQGQCEQFLDRQQDIAVITTQSNGTSLEQAQKGVQNEAAIVPAFAVKGGDFPLVIKNIADRDNNQTRFIAVAENPAAYHPNEKCKTSLLIYESVDRPGILSDILQAFARHDINLVSIMSRPTKETLGKYHFFIDVEGHCEEPRVRETLAELGQENTIRMLGSYPTASPVNEVNEKKNFLNPTDTTREDTPLLAASPFPAKDRPQISVAWGNGPYVNTKHAFSTIDLSVVKGKKVLLKPNAGRIATPDSGVTTNPQVVAALIDIFREAGAEVSVGESPITGIKTRDAFEASGIAAVAQERNCPLIDMDSRPFVPVDVPEGVAIQAIKVCPEIFEFDVIVSVPVMKMHMHTGVTLSVKNMKGCLWRRSKVDLHMLPLVFGNSDKPLNIAIADMSSVLRPHLSVIDGTIGMEGLGPSAGEPRPVDAVVVGTDPFAADSVACSLMGLKAHDVPHLRIGASRGYGTIDLGSIDITPENWSECTVEFAHPPDNLSVQFPGIEIFDNQSCSACQSTLLMFLRRYGDKVPDYFPKDSAPTIAIGKGHDTVPVGTLCIGNCTAKHKKQGTFVSGCPPVASQILKTISRGR